MKKQYVEVKKLKKSRLHERKWNIHGALAFLGRIWDTSLLFKKQWQRRSRIDFWNCHGTPPGHAHYLLSEIIIYCLTTSPFSNLFCLRNFYGYCILDKNKRSNDYWSRPIASCPNLWGFVLPFLDNSDRYLTQSTKESGLFSLYVKPWVNKISGKKK